MTRNRELVLKTNHSQHRIGTAIVVISLCFGIGIASSNKAQAQYPNDRSAQDQNRNDNQDSRGRNWDRYDNYGGSSQLRQRALNAGYNEGLKQGHNDRNRHNRSDYHNQSVYQNATKDYYSRLGDRELYRRYFREGYENGYQVEGYARNRNRDDRSGNNDRNDNGNGNQNRRGRNWDQYGNYGGTFQLRQTALNAGYNEGIKQGRSDRSSGNRTDYHSRSAYQKATADYSSGLGDREVYRRYYREAYENGFDGGINGY
jgi:hypothetical protein